MLKVTYRMNRWPEGKTEIWLAQDQQWVDWVSLVWSDSVIILNVEPA
jgi:hypothetical protein